MRDLVLAGLLCSASLGIAADPSVIRPPVRLDTSEDLAALRARNPGHYLRALRIMAEANVLCPPHRAKPEGAGRESAALESGAPTCGHLFLTSNPPKRELTFTLDGVTYVALVTITADPPRAMRVQ